MDSANNTNDESGVEIVNDEELMEIKDETTDFYDFSSVDDFAKDGLVCIVEATKCTNSLPSGSSRDLYSAYPSYGRIINTMGEKILNIISTVMKNQNVKGNILRRDNDEKFELLLECNDIMLERINSNIDDLAGIKKLPEDLLEQTMIQSAVPNARATSGSWNIRKVIETGSGGGVSAKLISARNILRPQINFKTKIDNSNNTPFEPRIKDKPNSIKPLAILPEYGDDGNIVTYLHPYEFELNKFEPLVNQMCKVEPVEPKSIETTPLKYVNSEATLKELLEDIRKVKEISVDLEHHSYRTFQGITCLMQISTREKDYIIDTLTLREDLHILNEVFTNPEVVKIFHGADSDIEWLQRDLSLYVVNMFDSHQAAKRLGLARLSLAYLLKHYCKVEADKTFQLADWRVRPLPEELILYARKDTHYLLYIYDVMKNELIKMGHGQKNILTSVYQSSTEICKKKYIKPRILTDSHLELYRKSKRQFDNRQLFALKEIFAWRDKIARMEDESYGYILPNHMMLQIAESLPREMQGILACCNPIPPVVRQNLHPLHQFVFKAREQPLVKPIIEESSNRAVFASNNRDINGPLYCPHDLSCNSEFRDDMPTLLGEIKEKTRRKEIKLAKPVLSVFETPEASDEDEEISEKMLKLKKIKFVSPFTRYKLILPFAEQQRLEAQAKEEELNKHKLLCPVKIEVEEFIVTKEEIPVESDQPIPLKKMIPKRKREAEEVHEDIVVENTYKKPKIDVFIDKNPSESNKSMIENSEGSSNRSPKKPFNKSNGKKGDRYFSKNDRQSSNKSVDFDYSKVDFNKFQGGSQRERNNDVKSKFQAKGKNSKIDMKKFNKMFTFSNVNKKK